LQDKEDVREKMLLRIIVRRHGKIICKQLSLMQTLTPLTLRFEFRKRLFLQGLSAGAADGTQTDRAICRIAREISKSSWMSGVAVFCISRTAA
jgi:hypothetical protein